jgi:hypothetical protein
MASTEIAALEHGGELVLEDGRPTAIRDRHGTRWAELAWPDGRLAARLRRPDGGTIELVAGQGEHPVLGPVDRLSGDGITAWSGAIDWAAPERIPPLDRPAALPPGAGSAVLGLVARLAARAGRATLRYAGPYPTDGLWATLLDCFHPVGDPDVARARFTAGGLERALSGTSVAVPVDLAPAPFVRELVADGAAAQLRDELEALWLDGLVYRRAPGDGRRLVAGDDCLAAALVIGGEPWATVGWIARDRSRLDRGAPPPSPGPRRPIDGRLRAGLLGLALADAPAPLAAALRALDPPLWLGDPGLGLAGREDGGIVVHAGYPERLDGEPLLRAMAAAIAPVARAMAQEALAAAWSTRSGT